MSKKLVLKNIKDIDIGNNEFLIPSVVNRALKKLFENDLALGELYAEVFGKIDIKAYNKVSEYQYGDMIWYSSNEKELYILRCTQDGNKNSPQLAIDEKDSYGTIPFEKYGWSDQNPKIDIIKMGIGKILEKFIISEYNIHTNDKQYHKFGKIDKENIGKHLLSSDMSNIDVYRENNFYPYLTERLESDNVILNGTRRIYQNKMSDGTSLMEYDINFQLGVDSNNKTIKHQGITYNLITANNVVIEGSIGSQASKNNNTDYFITTDDQTIFNWTNDNEENFSIIGDTYQQNRNGFVNVYAATINFKPPYFSDTNYMVFTGDIKSQDDNTDNHTVVSGTNTLTFCNKTTKSITVLLITIPEQTGELDEQFNIKNGGIVANSFHCRIVGKGIVS